MAEESNALPDPETVIELTSMLTGAFAEGADLGCREIQIRSIGESLEVSLQYIRAALINININPDGENISNHLDTIACLARLAANYDADDHDKTQMTKFEF